MKRKDWLNKTADPELQELAEKKIEQVQSFEKEIPAIIIVHSLQENAVIYMSQRGLDILGTTLDEIRISYPEYHSRYFNPEDAKLYVPKILGLIERNNSDEMVSFFQQVRRSELEEWSWYLSSAKIFMHDKEG